MCVYVCMYLYIYFNTHLQLLTEPEIIRNLVFLFIFNLFHFHKHTQYLLKGANSKAICGN